MKSVEVCVISARGLKRRNPFLKLRTMCVAWILSSHKFCSQIDKSGDTHPQWNLRFSTILENEDQNTQQEEDEERDQDPCLTVEIHSQEPVFHLSNFECRARISLKEFFHRCTAAQTEYEESTSVQLRSSREKPRGMLDLRIRVTHSQGFQFEPQQQHLEKLESTAEPATAYPAQLPFRVPSGRPQDFPPPNFPYTYPEQQQQQQNQQGFPGPPRFRPQNPHGFPGPPRLRPQNPHGFPGPAFPAQNPQGFPGPPRFPPANLHGFPAPLYAGSQSQYPPTETYVGLPGGGTRPTGALGAGMLAGALAGGALYGLGDSLFSDVPHFDISTDPLYYN